MTESPSNEEIGRQVQIMTTMHSVISGARASTVFEAIGRASMYLTTVSMTLVALGFISSATKMEGRFYVFAFVLLFCLIPVGIVSFNRVVQTGVQDLQLSQNEARIWEFYATASPGVEKWFGSKLHEARSSHVLLTGGGSRLQILFTAGSMVGGVNSAVVGVFAGLAAARFADAEITWATAAGAAAFLMSGWLHLRQQYAMFAVLEGAQSHDGHGPLGRER